VIDPPAAAPEPLWLTWARELQAVAQTGLAFTQGAYDRLRYTQIRELAARMLAAHAGLPAPVVDSAFAAEFGYATPKLEVRGAVFRDDRILMVREVADAGRWTLPGGWADVNLSPAECVAKEIREESGFEVRVTKLAAVHDRARHPHLPRHPFHVWKLFFVCELLGGAPATSLETSEVAFFAQHEVPADLSVGRVLPFQVQRMFAHARDPSLPTEFD